MDLIQFRIHPSVGMARFGKSKEWYFLGPEFPQFMQEQFPNLRHKSVSLRHPDAPAGPVPAKPADGLFRDAARDTMPQAARFRIFAYMFNVGSREPYKVVEVTSADADIAWTVTVANRKTVRSSTAKVEANDPATVTMTTNPASAPSSCKKAGSFPNLAWLALESGTGRLHVLGNEGEDLNLQTAASTAGERLYQFDWFDTAGDGPVTAVVKPKAAFLSRFAGFKYLVPGTKDAQSLPTGGAVDAVSAWVVVNMPDYVPDFGHITSLWDVVLAQGFRHVADGKVSAVDGRHFLATASSEINDYAFYDYHTHIHPVLTVFNDVNSTSGQTRNTTDKSSANEFGIVIQEHLTAAADTTTTSLSTSRRSALRLQAAALMDPASPTRTFADFNMVLSADIHLPFDTGHEIVVCTDIADDGTLTVTRATSGTAANTWADGKPFLAGPKGSFFEAELTNDVAVADAFLKVAPVSAHRMPQPSAASGDLNGGAFFIAITDTASATDVEWVKCTKNEKRDGKLRVDRAQLGTAARGWPKAGTILIATGGGHKAFDARKNMNVLARGARGAAHKRIFDRLRLPINLYQRKFATLNGSGETPFPRQYGRRYEITGADGIDTVSGGTLIPPGTSVHPEGSLAPQWSDPKIGKNHGKACKGDQMGTGIQRIGELDDFYWIASERDMPMLKDYAITQLQFDQFEYWATGKAGVVSKVPSKLRWAPLFTVLFEGTPIGAFLRAPGHTADEYFQEFAARLPRYTPAMLDMANLSKMFGGSFLPGIEVGREGGRRENWSLVHGATKYFPDMRFHPPTGTTSHPPGMLTKDLAIPWFRDFISCDETYWPTSRPQIVNHEKGFAYTWLHGTDHDTVDYWRTVGFIRRSGDLFVEQERTLDIRE